MTSSDAKSRKSAWLMRTYAGHSSAAASNELYRQNLDKGQTGLSVAFDLPTQTGYDPDHQLSQGEVGRVGVPISHLGDMRTLFDQIDLSTANTSMTINATAMWLLALYQTVAEEQGIDIATLRGTTQNDIVKEYLSRGTHVFAPAPSLRLTCDVIEHTLTNIPKWNPINICGYHLQEAGATSVQEIAFALSTAIAVLDAMEERAAKQDWSISDVVARMSFFVNSGVRFIEEICKMRAFSSLWNRIAEERYGVTDARQRRFRYGVQVNSLGLTQAQPENNMTRITLEMLGVTLSADARARAVQLPAWNEALGLPRPWDQQWSLRTQQVLAYESDLLEYGDIFDGSTVIENKTEQLIAEAWNEIEHIQKLGGVIAAVESGYLKSQLVASHASRRARIESGEDKVVGVNCFTNTEPNPLTANLDTATMQVDPAIEATAKDALDQWKSKRDEQAVSRSLSELRTAANSSTQNLMPATLNCVRAGVTTGEWSQTLRDVFGEYRAPTGVAAAPVTESSESTTSQLRHIRDDVARIATSIKVPRLRLLIGKPGLDGHSNGAEQIAVRARDAGFEVIYAGIRLTPEQIVATAIDEDVHCIGLSILSGAHADLVPRVVELLKKSGAGEVPVIVGGIIPDSDAKVLRKSGVAGVFTPQDFDLTDIMGHIVSIIGNAHHLSTHSPKESHVLH